MALAISAPFEQFFDLDGSPLDDGQLFFGVVNQNPETNPVVVYWDSAGTQPAAQPVRTKNGYPSRGGSIGTLWVSGDYSLTIRTKKRDLVAYVANANEAYAALISELQAELVNAPYVVNTIADLRAATSTATLAQTRGYWQVGDKGHATYALQPVGTPPADNGGTVIVRTDGRWYAMQVEGEYITANSCGVYAPRFRLETPSGVPGYFNRWSGAIPSTYLAPAFLPNGYSSVDRLNAAFDQARTLGKGVLIDGVVHCDKQINIAAPTRVAFAGRNGNAGGNLDINLPDSYLFQANTAMVGSVLVLLQHDGIWLEGGGVVGTVYYNAVDNFYYPEGPARDGVFFGGNGAIWERGCFARMGRDGIRIGDYSGGPGTNANSIRLTHCVTAYNGNNGITVNDASGSLDANAFQIDSLFTHNNFNSGVELANTYLGGLFNAPVVEANGRGWFINNSATGIVIVAGDTEANDGWRGGGPLQNIVEDPAVVGLNYFVSHTVQGILRNDMPEGSRIKRDYPSRTGLFLENKSTNSSADTVLSMETTAGFAAMWKRSAVVGGEMLIGNQSAFPIGFVTNNVIRAAFLGDGSLALGGLSAVGTPGQVLTSQGPGTPPIWSSAGGGGGGSPLTTKGDLFTYSTAADRLPVGTDGQVLVADSTTATGLRWNTVTGTGTVTSVGMTVPTGLSVSGSPITGAGTLAVTYAAGYQGFLSADKTKLDSITVANLALRNAANTFTESQTVSKNQNLPTGHYVTNTDAGSGANAEVLLTANGGTGGMRLLSTAAGGQLIFGNAHTGEVVISQNGTFRIVIDASGNIEFRGLPSSAGGNPERVWRDGSNYLRIG